MRDLGTDVVAPPRINIAAPFGVSFSWCCEVLLDGSANQSLCVAGSAVRFDQGFQLCIRRLPLNRG